MSLLARVSSIVRIAVDDSSPDSATEDSPTNPRIDRRRFLTVLGASGAGAVALSGCSTDRVEKLIPYLVQSEDQVPGVRDLVRQHLHRMRGRLRRPRAHPRGPRGQARRQPRAPGQPGQAVLPGPGRAAGPLQPRPAEGADGARRRRAAPGDHLGRCHRAACRPSWAAAGRQGRGDLRRRAGHLLGSAGRVDRRAGRPSWCATSRSTAEPLRAANRQVFGLDQLPAHDFAKAKYIVSFGADFLETWPGADREPARLCRIPRLRSRSTWRKLVVLRRPGWILTGLNADEWHPSGPDPRRRWRWPWPTCSSAERRRRGAGWLRRLPRLLRRWRPRKPGFPPA